MYFIQIEIALGIEIVLAFEVSLPLNVPQATPAAHMLSEEQDLCNRLKRAEPIANSHKIDMIIWIINVSLSLDGTHD
jgi:hypothetical protein